MPYRLALALFVTNDDFMASLLLAVLIRPGGASEVEVKDNEDELSASEYIDKMIELNQELEIAERKPQCSCLP